VIGSWRNTDRLGRVLRTDALSTRLTKATSYRQTLCGVEAEDYLLYKPNGEEELIVVRAEEARKETVRATEELIAHLHWADFETLVDLLFARSDWHCASVLGGMKTAGLVLEQTITDKTALVHVKSSATQATLDEHTRLFDENAHCARLFFVCHSPQGELDPGSRHEVQVWTRGQIAERVITSVLFDWLTARAA
jgi:hypothetical protein